jgi:hypothetical protein
MQTLIIFMTLFGGYHIIWRLYIMFNFEFMIKYNAMLSSSHIVPWNENVTS